MSRVKTVFQTSEIAHLWANQSVSNAHNARGNFYFNENEIFSYGSHFLAGKIVTDSVIVLNNNPYSITTSKHMNYIYRAIDKSKYQVFNVIEPDIKVGKHNNHVKNVTDMFISIKNSAQLLNSARTRKGEYTEDINRKKQYIINYCDTFRCKSILTSAQKSILNAETKDLSDKYIALRKADIKRQKAAKAKDARIRNENAAIELAKWFNFEINRCYKQGVVSLRVNGDQIETTLGVKIPLIESVALWPLILHSFKNSCRWENSDNSVKIGHYKVDYITKEGHVKAGCHWITFEVLLGIAKELKLQLP